MDPLASFTFETFRGRVGEPFSAPDASTELTLTAVTDLGTGDGARAGGAFSLQLEAAGDVPLPQAIHSLAHDELGEFGVFLKPLARTPTGFVYEAVFN